MRFYQVEDHAAGATVKTCAGSAIFFSLCSPRSTNSAGPVARVMPPHVSGDAFSAGRGEPLEPRRYIDAVPVNIVGRHDDVAEIDADAKLDAAVLRQPGIARPKRVLHIERAAHRV